MSDANIFIQICLMCITPVNDDDGCASTLDRKATNVDAGDEVDANLGRTAPPHPLYVSHLWVMECVIRTEIPTIEESNSLLLMNCLMS